MSRPTNWAGNVTFAAARIHRPASVAQVQEVVAGSERVRALGSGHSFNGIADTTGDLVVLRDLPRSVTVDRASSTVTVDGGARYGDVVGPLDEAGLALHNLGSLPHICVAGACATSTHGSGDGNRSLAAAVSALQVVGADGEISTLTRERDGDTFAGAVVSLGALGVVTALTLDAVPAFAMRQHVYDDLPWPSLWTHAEEIFASAYSVSVFTDWASPQVSQVWRKERCGAGQPAAAPRRWLGATLAETPRHPIATMSPRHCTEQRGVVGAWKDRLPHFRLEFTPSSGAELQSEYLLPRDAAVPALQALRGMGERIAPALHISEVRTVAADDLWLSPSYGRDSVAVHFTWVDDADLVAPVVAAVEERLADFAPRPHWGKVSGLPAAVVRGSYARADDFAALLRRRDPAGKFRNDFLDHYFPVG